MASNEKTSSERTHMIDRSFDPNAFFSASREAFAPVLKAQQEGFKSLERLARLQYAVAGDLLESGLAHVNAGFIVGSAGELFSKHSELNSQLVEKLRSRVQEFASVTSEIQAKFTQLGSEIASKSVPARKAA
jgi:hypothetical protein